MGINPNPPRDLPKPMRDLLSSGQARWSPILQRPVTDDERAYWAEMVAAKQQAQRYVVEASDEPCPMCDGLGVVRGDFPRDHADYGRLFPCPNPECSARKAQERDRFVKLNTSAAIPPMYRDLTFERWQRLIESNPDAMAGKWDAWIAARMFIEATPRRHLFTLAEAAAFLGIEPAEVGDLEARRNGIVFSGANGVGKTSLAVAIANWLIANGHSCVYVRLDDLFESLRKTFQRDAETTESDVMGVYRTAPVLVIDELTPDRAKPTDWQTETVHRLINARYTASLPTVITTNTAHADFADIWGMTTGSRVLAMCHWLKMGGGVLRPRSAETTSR